MSKEKALLKYFINNKWLIATVLAAIIAFLCIYGITPLNVTNDRWIMAEYDEKDIIGHYAGWLSFRNSEWAFPLGYTSSLAYPEGTMISYMDSLPWISIFFKIFRGILPETFQFFGIYVLLSFILQGISSFLIVREITDNDLYAFISSNLFLFSPVLLERSFRHTALGSQWLILFAILIYIKNHKKNKYMYYAMYTFLMILAIGIHPYFLPMVGVFLLSSVLEDITRKRYIAIALFAGGMAITYGTGCLLGVLGSGKEVTRFGYGYYSMNLNAIINPTSLGGYTWSSIIKSFPQTLGNYDGFNYLGFGILIGLFILFPAILLCKKAKNLARFLRAHIFLVIGLILCTIFAVSNVVTLNEKIVFQVNLPDKIEALCGIFRASSRLFYPVYYCIFLTVVYGIWKYRYALGKKSYIVLSIIVLVQLFDIHSCIFQKHNAMVKNASYNSILDDQVLKRIASDKESMVIDAFNDPLQYKLGVWGAKNGLNIIFPLAGSGTFDIANNYSEKIITHFSETGELKDTVLVVGNRPSAEAYTAFDNIGVYKYQGYYFVADMKIDPAISKYIPEDSYTVSAADYTDENWDRGVFVWGNAVLIPYDSESLRKIYKAETIRCNGEVSNITGIDFDEQWIQIWIDSDDTVYAYPSEIVVE